eukprot:4947316-Amphidinium_carterae.1
MPNQGEKNRKSQAAPRGRQAPNQKARLPTSLTLEEKFRISNQEVEALTKDIEQTKRTSEQNIDILKALMEETDIRIAE